MHKINKSTSQSDLFIIAILTNNFYNQKENVYYDKLFLALIFFVKILSDKYCMFVSNQKSIIL